VVGIKRKTRKKVRTGLEKQTANLDPEDANTRYGQARTRMAVKTTLDKFGIKDPKKRKKVHDIMQRMDNRVRMLIETKAIQSAKGALKRGISDLYLKQCTDELREELGKTLGRQFYNKFMLSKLVLSIQIRPKKRKDK